MVDCYKNNNNNISILLYLYIRTESCLYNNYIRRHTILILDRFCFVFLSFQTIANCVVHKFASLTGNHIFFSYLDRPYTRHITFKEENIQTHTRTLQWLVVSWYTIVLFLSRWSKKSSNNRAMNCYNVRNSFHCIRSVTYRTLWCVIHHNSVSSNAIQMDSLVGPFDVAVQQLYDCTPNSTL
jgi:hypothetical protein